MESLGLTLIRDGIVTPTEVAYAARIRDGRPLAERLVRLGLASDASIADAVKATRVRAGRAPLARWKGGRPVASH